MKNSARRRTPRPRSPTQHGSELDSAVLQILQKKIPRNQKAQMIFELLQTHTTPGEFGGRTALEVAVITVQRKLNGRLPHLLDPLEIPSLIYLAIYDAVVKWDPSKGLAFLAYVVNGTLNRARPRPRQEHRVITFTELQAMRREEIDEDRWGMLMAIQEEWA